MDAHRTSAADLARAAAAWPDLAVPAADFAAYVAERAGDAAMKETSLEALYVACACVRGDVRAARAFDQRYLPAVRRALGRMRLSTDDVDELVQRLRRQLLVGEDGAPPRIASYGGQGDLEGWLRVTAVRSALKLKKKTASEGALDDSDAKIESRSAGLDPELGYMKALYRDAFKVAFGEAIGGLDARDKNLLRQHFVDGLTVDDLGKVYGVHRATAARWVQKAQGELLKSTRKRFAERAKVGARECDSVLRLVQSRLDVTLRGLLV
ncbi:MAG TPA: sigma-70 family RNA polymerase sigma factor [Byssovorax sp.]